MTEFPNARLIGKVSDDTLAHWPSMGPALSVVAKAHDPAANPVYLGRMQARQLAQRQQQCNTRALSR